jgi:hypothetical protein
MLTKIFTATVLSVGVGVTASASTQATTSHTHHCHPYLKSCQAGPAWLHTTTRADCSKTHLACCEHALQRQAAQNRWVESLSAKRLTGNAFLIERPTANSPPC